MALTRKGAVKFVHTDINGNLYEVHISLDGVGRVRPYPPGRLRPDITYNLAEVPFTVDAAGLALWRSAPLDAKKVAPLYNGGLTLEQILNPI